MSKGSNQHGRRGYKNSETEAEPHQERRNFVTDIDQMVMSSRPETKAKDDSCASWGFEERLL